MVCRAAVRSALCVLFLPSLLLAQSPSFEFFPGGVYDPNIPTINTALGYEVGERMTRHAGVEQYLAALSNASNRVKLFSYGKSYEGRTLYYLVISDARNIGRLDVIKQNLAKLAETRALASPAAAEQLIEETPAITWLSYGVHGDEHSSTEAAMLTAYQLAAGQDDQTKRILDQTVVIIDPIQNPDGRERFINYYYSVVGMTPSPDPNAVEHNQPWPSGRGNHYLFDLNRDWFYLTQQETAGKVRAFLEWHPQVFVDLHEMEANSSYYFAPPALPINTNYPETVKKWWQVYGKGNAAAFDRLGFDYYTQEVFDTFYPGYGDSWPTFNGAVGMTYEQASARGLVVKREDETTLTLRDAVWRHFTASMATCATTAANREDRLRDYYQYFKTALDEGTAGPVKEYLIVPDAKALNAAKLVGILMQQHIEVKVAQAEFSNAKVHDYVDGKLTARTFPKGTYLIRMNQPQKRLIQAIFEKEAKIDDRFIAEEKERQKRKLPDRFYDITAWSIPFAYDVDVVWTEEVSRVTTADLTEPPKLAGRPVARAAYAYLFRYTSNDAAKAVTQLLRDGYRVHVAKEAFTLNKEKFDRGTLIVKVKGNKDGLHDRMGRLASELGIDIFSSDTGWTEDGIDLGSDNVVYLKTPKVAVVYDTPTSSTSAGALLYVLEQRYGIPFTAIRASAIPSADLSEYNVLIMPDGSSNGYAKALDESGARRLKEWVSNGGTLVAIKGAFAYAGRKGVELTTSTVVTDLRTVRKDEKDEAKKSDASGNGKKEEPKKDEKSELIPDDAKPIQTPGAILKVHLDPTHFLTYGYGVTVPALVNSDYVFIPSKNGMNVGTFAEKPDLRMSGFVWDRMLDAYPKQAYVVDEPTGRGHVIGFADDPAFRGYWDGLNRLLLNSILFGPSLTR
ncbi:MAG: peptidase M14 [Candidatus Latescibacteria bacterium]|nr:peptidase M14 [Candidatus Latescibacterota bacterium]